MTTKILLFVSLLVIVLANLAYGGNIGTYWGQNHQESSLKQTCATKLYSYVNIAFLDGNGRRPKLNILEHCNPLNGGCKFLSDEIKYCQSVGIKVFLSIGSNNGVSYTFNSASEATDLATYLWNNFLGGTSLSRPFGNAVLDGIDFYGATKYYDHLARCLASYSTRARKVYLSVAPRCFLPDHYTDLAVNTGLFDYIWPRFYDHPTCDYTARNANNFFKAWNYWTKIKTKKVFLGLPAHPKAVNDGFIPVNVLKSEVLLIVKKSPKYGGVMVWNRYWDQIGKYSPPLKNIV